MAVNTSKSSTARAVLVGIFLLAVAAIIIAWLNQAGVFDQIYRATQDGRYGQ